MRLLNQAGLSAESLTILQGEIPAHGTLLDVWRWLDRPTPEPGGNNPAGDRAI
ncbi:MAG: hypothetical protein ACKV2V_05510 [Blastocatellia bacterium]